MTQATFRVEVRRRALTLAGPRSIDIQDVTVVVPVRNNGPGAHRLLVAFRSLPTTAQPAAIVVVDNGSAEPLTLPFSEGVSLMACATPGAAAARNVGWRAATTPWVLFLDADCVPTELTVPGFFDAANGAIAYAGQVRALDSGPLVSFYEAQKKTLVPPPTAEQRPEYLVTANALVGRPALEAIGGFEEAFDSAGGEDIDLALRLRAIGELSYAPMSVVLHEFGNDPLDFVRRFVRYGRGNRQLERLHGGSMRPRRFAPAKRRPLHWACALVQYAAMTVGYHRP